MIKIRVVEYVEPIELMGKFVKVQLKGAAKSFGFKINEVQTNTAETSQLLNGHDEEGLNLSINTDDIDFIYGG